MSRPSPFCFAALFLLSLCGTRLSVLAQSGDSEVLPDDNDNDTDTDYDDYGYTDYDYDDYDYYPEGVFRCKDGVKNISIYSRCDNEPDCLDGSDESSCSPSVCPSDTFQCKDGSNVTSIVKCLNVSRKCDGIVNCHDISDELASECDKSSVDQRKDSTTDDCGDPAKFKCRFQGQVACLSKERYQCDGNIDCDDWKDEAPSACDECDRPGLFKCKDGSQCVKAKADLCDKKPHCVDGSDESETWAKCSSCQEKGSLPCPGFEEICATPCDGNVQCPDQWDELLATCEALDLACTEDAGLHPCADGSRCIRKENYCDNFQDCGDGEDESSKLCKGKCESLEGKNALLHCDDSCIRREQACSSRTRPLCEDGKDMESSLCDGKCYHEFPGRQDPYRSPCKSEGKCILMTSIHDGSVDCEKATDEEGRPWYADLNLFYTLLLAVAVVILAWLLHRLISVNDHSLQIADPSFPIESTPSVKPTQTVPLENLALGKSSDADIQGPTFLDHPALVNIDNPNWSDKDWQEVGKELGIEDSFFNKDTKSLVALLSHIEAQDAHPKSLQKVFNGFLNHLETKGHFKDAVAAHLKESIGHHRLGLLALAASPNILTVKIYETRKSTEDLESAGTGFFFFIIQILRKIRISVFPLFFFLDYVKDLVLYPLVKDTVKRLDAGCRNISALGFNCLAASTTEEDLLAALLTAICLSIIITSLFAFANRKMFVKTSPLLDVFLFIFSPLLPAVFHIHVGLRNEKLEKKRKQMSNLEYQEEMLEIERLTDVILKAKSIEIGLEALMQILLFFGFGTFAAFSLEAPSGQSYSYFYSVATIVLRGNKGLVAFSLVVSFLGPAWFFTKQVIHVRHRSFSFGSKLMATAQNIFFLAARLGSFILALFVPVISQWNIFSRNAGIDASSRLGYTTLSFEFNRYFSAALNTLSSEVRTRSFVFLFFVVLHLLVVYLHASYRSPKFGTSKIVDRCLHLLSSFWLPTPFLTLVGLDRGEEEAQLWFLVALHSVENFVLIVSSVFVHFEGNFALGLLAMQIGVLFANLIGVSLAVIYKRWIQLYAGLKQDLPPPRDFESKVTSSQ